jgi:hypothetical protein
MTPASATVRASQLRKRLKDEAGAILPSPQGGESGGGRKLDVSSLAATIAALQAADTDDDVEDSESAEG